MVDALRGLAAAAVVWFHLTHLDFRLLPDGALKQSGAYGWLGVDVFFVISGFIIPWSLYRAGYTARGFARFVARRVVRLDPPYLASMLLVVALAAAAPLLPAGSTRHPITARELALHLGYANVLFGERWLNPVYWTLAIELQWYLLVGAIYPVIADRAPRRRALALVALLTAMLLPDLPGAPLRSLIFPFLGLFVMGMAAFQRRTGIASWRWFACALAAGTAATGLRMGWPVAIAGAVAACLIAGVERRPRLLAALGEISYSLYLVHSPVSMPFLRYATVHHLGPAGRLTMIGAAAAASFAAAWLLWRFVEEPARRWSARVAYARVARPPARIPAIVGGASVLDELGPPPLAVSAGR